MDEDPKGFPSGQTAVWSALFAILVGASVVWLIFWSLETVGLPPANAWLGGLFSGYFTSRAVLRAIWQRRSDRAASAPR